MTAAQAETKDLVNEAASGDAASQYLTFILAGEEYGVEILRVQEIKGWDAVTPIPNTPEHVLGVLNLRGAIVPIVDLRKRFGLETVEFGKTTVVIVVRMQHDDQERTVGLVVDAVADVYRLDSDDVQPPPVMGTAIDTRFVKGLAVVEEQMVILLEIDDLIDFRVDGLAASANDSDARDVSNSEAAGN